MIACVVKGEEELGVQRLCPGCQEWWPDDHCFFPRWESWRGLRCRSCLAARRATHHTRRVVQADLDAARQERRREQWRAYHERKRARTAGAA